MNKGPEASFEILHLVSTLSIRFNLIFKKCGLDVEQIYVLAYIKSHGTENKQKQVVLLRETITKVLKEVFGCNDTQVSKWVSGLVAGKLLGETTLGKKERVELFSARKGGRNKAITLRKKGQTKLSLFVDELVKFRLIFTQQNSKLLYPPGTKIHGPIASTLIYYFSQFENAGINEPR